MYKNILQLRKLPLVRETLRFCKRALRFSKRALVRFKNLPSLFSNSVKRRSLYKEQIERLKKSNAAQKETIHQRIEILKKAKITQKKTLSRYASRIETLVQRIETLKLGKAEQKELLIARIDVLKAKVYEIREESKPFRRKARYADLLVDGLSDEFGCIANYRPDWEARWADPSRKKVLLFATKDYSGSFYKWAQAINRHTEFAARLVVLMPHPFKYPLDLVSGALVSGEWGGLKQLFRQADLLHIKDETGFYKELNGLPPDLLEAVRDGVPRIYTAYGGAIRQAWADRQFKKHVESFDDCIAMTPDLNFEGLGARFIPHAIDVSKYTFSWKPGKSLAHSPSTALRKGTGEFLEAVEQLKHDGFKFDMDLISNVSHSECVERKRKASIFFDQAGREQVDKLGIDTVIGWYGNSALEAAVFGIPTIAHMSDIAFDGAERAGRDIRDKCAMINTELGRDGIHKTLKNFLEMENAEKEVLSRETRNWIEEFHSYEAVAVELDKCYKSLVG